jgi:hypothetical protein
MTTASSPAASSLRHSVEINQVRDKNPYNHDISPSNMSLLIESPDGSNDDHVKAVGWTRSRSSSFINVNDDSSDDVLVETDEAARGMTHESISNHMLTVH